MFEATTTTTTRTATARARAAKIRAEALVRVSIGLAGIESEPVIVFSLFVTLPGISSNGRDIPDRLAKALRRGGGILGGGDAPRCGDQGRGRTGGKGRAEQLRAPALGADSGDEEDRARHQLTQTGDALRLGGPD